MLSLLGLASQATAPVSDLRTKTPMTYCVMDPWIYLEIGYRGGPLIDRIEARLNQKASYILVKNFAALCNGDNPTVEMGIRPSLQGAPLHMIDSERGVICSGDYIYKNGCGGRSADTSSGIVHERDTRTGPASAGSIVMLPLDTDRTAYNSIFCILTKDVPYVEGKVIGNVTKGLDSLKYIVWKFGRANGIPKEKIIIQACGQM